MTRAVQYIPPRRALRGPVGVHIADWMIPATVGSVAGFIAGLLTRAIFDGHHDKTKDAAAYMVNSGVFLIVGGLTWVVRESRKT